MDTKKQVQKQFGDNAQNYVDSEVFAKGYSLGRLVEIVQPQAQWHVLDIATGGGHTALKFAEYVQKVVATDLTQPMILAARDHIRDETKNAPVQIEYARCDAENLPFPDASFDLITCRIACHHFPDVGKFIRECARVVRPGGVVAIIDMIAPTDKQSAHYLNAFDRLRDPSHHWTYNLREWQDFFEAAALQPIHEEPFDNPQNFSKWVDRMSCPEVVVEQLRTMLIQAPPPIKKWLAPQLPIPGSGEAIHFVIRQAFMIARRP